MLLAPARGGGGMRTAGGFCGRAAGVVVLDAAAFLLEEGGAFIEKAGRLWKPSTTTVVQPAARASTMRGRRRGAILLVWSVGRGKKWCVCVLMAPEDFNPDRATRASDGGMRRR